MKKRRDGILAPDDRYRTWGYVVNLGRDPVTSKRRQKTVRGFARRKDAVAARGEVVAKLGRGTYFEPSKQPLGEFLVGEWLPSRRDSLKASTFERYRIDLECHIVPRLGSIPISGLTTARLNEFYEELRRNGRRDGSGKGLSEQSVRNVHAALRKALGDAVRVGKILRNPAEYASPPRPERPEMRIWTGEELSRFLRLAAEDRLHALYLLVATTGMRRGEVLGLRWPDVDLDRGSLEIRRALIAVSYRDVKIGPLKSRKGKPKSRNLPLDPRAVAAIRTHKARQAEERLAWGPAYEDSGFVFTRENSTLIHPASLSSAFERLVRSLNVSLKLEDQLPEIRFHDLRHTWATLALRAGIHPKIVQTILGHSTIAITLDTYTHAIPSLGQEAATLVADIALGASS